MIKDLDYYLNKLRTLRVDHSSGHAKPHKVCLLFAVMDLIDQGIIKENRIDFSEQLKQQFSKRFGQLKHGSDKDDPSQPFFYLESSGFWHHKPNAEHESEYRERIKERNHGGSGIVSRIIDYAYMDDELLGFFKSPVSRMGILGALQENLGDSTKSFEFWALGIGKSEKTVKNYSGAISGSISNWAVEAGLSDSNLIEIGSYKNYYAIAEQVRKLEIFGIRDTKGNGMYSAALNLYGEFLADTTRQEVEEDIAIINQDYSLDNTEKSILVNTRIGQGQFRKNLISYWGGCAVTNYKDTRFLIASHIKPWRAAENFERLDTYNGVLLLPNFDKAFDLGFITFNENGGIRVSEEIEQRETLGVEANMAISITNCHQDYMAYHRETVFRQ